MLQKIFYTLTTAYCTKYFIFVTTTTYTYKNSPNIKKNIFRDPTNTTFNKYIIYNINIFESHHILVFKRNPTYNSIKDRKFCLVLSK